MMFTVSPLMAFTLMLVSLRWTIQGFPYGQPLMNPRKAQGMPRFLSRSDITKQDLRDEAEALLSKARQLREEIGAAAKCDIGIETTKAPTRNALSPWSVKNEEEGDEYRLYIDIGREEGTWMDPRWGASGRRISLTLDIKFLRSLAENANAAKMVKDNNMGKSSAAYATAVAGAARLRSGFDKMKCCDGGCYRIDSAKGNDTVRFYLQVEGTSKNQEYGCV